MQLSKINRPLVTISRWCGYSLFFFLLLYFLSGFGMGKHIIPRRLAKFLHEDILPVPTFVAFLLHGLFNIKVAIIRKGIKDQAWWNVYLGAIGLLLLGLFLYIFIR